MEIYNINGKQEQTADIRKLVVYGHGVILYEYEQNYFKQYERREDRDGELILSVAYGGELEKITLNKPIKRANKENLNRTDNYTLYYDCDYLREKRKALYIHESEINVIPLGDLLAHKTDEERAYLKAAKLIFKNPVVVKNLHLEHIPCDGKWTIPDGGKWGSWYGTAEAPCYDTYDYSKSLFSKKAIEKFGERGVIKRWYTLDTIENAEILTAERFYRKFEYSDERKRKDKIAEALNNSGLFRERFSHYDIDKLEKVLELKVKAGRGA